MKSFHLWIQLLWIFVVMHFGPKQPVISTFSLSPTHWVNKLSYASTYEEASHHTWSALYSTVSISKQRESLKLRLSTPIAKPIVTKKTSSTKPVLTTNTTSSVKATTTLSPSTSKVSKTSSSTTHRLLTREEELAAGQLCKVGRVLESVRSQLVNQSKSNNYNHNYNNNNPNAKLSISKSRKQQQSQDAEDRISIQMWSRACNLTEPQLIKYYSLALKARRKLVTYNLRYVTYLLQKLRSKFTSSSHEESKVSYTDLYAEAVRGMYEATIHYDGRDRFIKYAQLYIRSRIYQGLSELRVGAYLPHQMRMIAYRARRLRQQEQQMEEDDNDQTGELLTSSSSYNNNNNNNDNNNINNLQQENQEEAHQQHRAIANRLGVSSKSLQQSLKQLQLNDIIASTHQPFSSQNSFSNSNSHNQEDALTYLDVASQHHQPTHLQLSSSLMAWQIDFLAALDCLESAEKRMVILRYGLLDGKPRTNDKTAELMCVATETVRSTIRNALHKIAQSTYAKILEEIPMEMQDATNRIKMR
jgi:DNA-directed RNA polymerase sigma subunit (sigma70/sigma32)